MEDYSESFDTDASQSSEAVEAPRLTVRFASELEVSSAASLSEDAEASYGAAEDDRRSRTFTPEAHVGRGAARTDVPLGGHNRNVHSHGDDRRSEDDDESRTCSSARATQHGLQSSATYDLPSHSSESARPVVASSRAGATTLLSNAGNGPERTALSAALGLSRPKYIAAHRVVPSFTGRHAHSRTFAADAELHASSCAGVDKQRTAGLSSEHNPSLSAASTLRYATGISRNTQPRAPTVAGASSRSSLVSLTEQMSDGALLDVVINSLAASSRNTTGGATPSSRLSGSTSGGATTSVSEPRNLFVAAAHSLTASDADAIALLAQAVAQPFVTNSSSSDHGSGGVVQDWGREFDAVYTHTVMHLSRLSAEGAVAHTVASHDRYQRVLYVNESQPEVAAAHIRQAGRSIARDSTTGLHVAHALTSALQDMLADAPVVALIREAVAAKLTLPHAEGIEGPQYTALARDMMDAHDTSNTGSDRATE